MLEMQEKLRVNGSLIGILVFVLFANIFFLHAFGIVAVCLLTLGLWVLVLHMFERGNKETKVIKPLTGAILLTSLTLLLTVNSAEKVLLLGGTCLVTLVVASYSYLKGGAIGGILELVLSVIHMGLEYVRSGFGIILGMLNGQIVKMLGLNAPLKKQSPWVKSIAIGAVVGIPVVGWLISTLSSADPIFATALHGFVSTKLLAEMPVRIIFSVFIFLVLLPLLIMKWRGYQSPLAWLTKVSFGREMAVVTGMIVVILGAFLAIQWPYVFVSVAREVDMSRFGVATYSEYVQRGFWDLLKVAAMVFGVTWIGYLLNKNQKGKERQLLLGTQAILALEFVVFVVSIFRRVWIYQSFHGLSLARLYGMALLVLLVGMMVTLGLRFVYKNVQWVKVEAAWLLLIVFGTVAINMERLVVMDPPTVNGRVDYVYLSRLSSDGKEGWLKSYTWAKNVFDANAYKSGVINKEERRDVYYAGIITHQLTNNYHELIMQYGTESELKEYEKAILEAKIVFVNNISVENYAGENGQVTNKTHELEQLNGMLSDLGGKEPFAKVNVEPRWGRIYGPNYQFYNDFPRQNDVLLYYTAKRSSQIGLIKQYDKMLSFSWAGDNTYHWLQNHLGVAKLLELQKLDLAAQTKWGMQSKDERDIDVDISFESQFLK